MAGLCGVSNAQITRRRGPLGFLANQTDRGTVAHLCHNAGKVIGAAVVTYDNFEFVESLTTCQAPKAIPQQIGSIPNGNHNSDSWDDVHSCVIAMPEPYF